MGLDSVELLMDIENYFGISISNAEAEKMYTVKDMVTTILQHLNISSENTELKDDVFKKLKNFLSTYGSNGLNTLATDLISDYILIDDKSKLAELSNALDLDVPKPEVVDKNNQNIFSKIEQYFTRTPDYDWFTLTVDDFMTAICAKNYLKLIEKNNIKSTYEVYIAVVAITVEKTGVDYFEVTPDKSFTKDLGID